MIEANRRKFGRENDLLEYWRKHYLGEVGIVCCVSCGIIYAVLNYVAGWGGKTLLCCGVGLVAYLMIKEVRESLQTRGEKIFWEKAPSYFEKVVFDYALQNKYEQIPEEFKDGKICETYNSMQTEKYLLEEKWLYSLISSKFIPLTQTFFRGIVVTIEHPNEDSIIMADAEKLKKFFRAEKCVIQRQNDKISLWLTCDKKIFYQLQLLRKNELADFVGKVSTLKVIMDDISN